MKRTLLVFLLAYILIRCIDEGKSVQKETITATGHKLSGKWLLVEYLFSIGDSNQHSTPVGEGYTYTFFNNGSFASQRLDGCSGGTYEIQKDRLILIFSCNDGNKEYIENLAFKDGYLLLSPRSPVMCVDGCTYKFEKVE